MSMWGFKVDEVNTWAYMDNVFTPKECKKLIDIALKKPKLDGSIGGSNHTQVVDPSIRSNKVIWLTPQDEGMVDYYRKLTDVITSLNDHFFKFDLYGFTEQMQFTEYNEPGDKYDQHIDKMYLSLIRKLSVVVQLTDPDDYDGCDLEIYNSNKPEVMKRDQGSVIVFPSYTLHQVTPITRGTRHSLVAWIGGPNFK